MAFFVASAGHVHCSIVPQPVPKICPQHLRSPGVWLEQRAQPSSSTSLRERASLNVESAGTEADPRVAPTCLDVLGNGTSVDEANAGIFVAAVPGSVPCPLGSDAHIQPLLSLKQRRARTERRRYGDRDRSVRVGSRTWASRVSCAESWTHGARLLLYGRPAGISLVHVAATRLNEGDSWSMLGGTFAWTVLFWNVGSGNAGYPCERTHAAALR
jgi:hypothetical protein